METVLENFVVDEKTIRNLQARLNTMIIEYGSDNLLNPEIIKFSQLLDSFIAAYLANTSNCGDI